MPFVPIPGLPERLRLLRNRANYSVRVVARRTGYAPSTVEDWELGRRLPNAHHLMALARCYGVSESWILNGDG